MSYCELAHHTRIYLKSYSLERMYPRHLRCERLTIKGLADSKTTYMSLPLDNGSCLIKLRLTVNKAVNQFIIKLSHKGPFI